MQIVPDPQETRAIEIISQIVSAVTKQADNTASGAMRANTPEMIQQQRREAMEIIERLSVLIPPRTQPTIIVTREELAAMGIALAGRDATPAELPPKQ
jgi:Tfp pilus assembly protein PilN